MDMKILDWIQRMSTPWLDKFMIAVTTLGKGNAVWLASAIILFLIPKTRRLGAAMDVSLALEILCCNVILKPLIARVRPCDVNTAVQLLINRPADFSFPSGHAGAAFAAASALYFERSRLWIPAGVLAVLIAFSRLYLYVHYPSDVLVGAMIGIMIGWAAAFFTDKADFLILRKSGRQLYK